MLDFKSVAVVGLKNKPHVTSRSQLSVCLRQYCYNLIIFILLFLRAVPKLSDSSQYNYLYFHFNSAQSDVGWLVMMTMIKILLA